MSEDSEVELISSVSVSDEVLDMDGDRMAGMATGRSSSLSLTGGDIRNASICTKSPCSIDSPGPIRVSPLISISQRCVVEHAMCSPATSKILRVVVRMGTQGLVKERSLAPFEFQRISMKMATSGMWSWSSCVVTSMKCRCSGSRLALLRIEPWPSWSCQATIPVA